MKIEIDNWTSSEEARELQRLAAGKTVLEVGCFKGFGTVLMALAGATVWAVDWHRGDSGGDPGLGEQDTLCAWWRNVRRHGVEDRVIGLVGRSRDVLPGLTGRFDLAFIDADHAYSSVIADASYAARLMREDGLLVFHDYCSAWPDVQRAVDELVSVRGLRLRTVGSLAILGLSLRAS